MAPDVGAKWQAQGTIYLEEHEQPERNRYGENDQAKLMTYWGYKFETLCTIDKPPSELTGPDDEALQSRKTDVCNTNVQYCSVFRTKLGKNSLVMGGEVDCLVAGEFSLMDQKLQWKMIH